MIVSICGTSRITCELYLRHSVTVMINKRGLVRLGSTTRSIIEGYGRCIQFLSNHQVEVLMNVESQIL